MQSQAQAQAQTQAQAQEETSIKHMTTANNDYTYIALLEQVRRLVDPRKKFLTDPEIKTIIERASFNVRIIFVRTLLACEVRARQKGDIRDLADVRRRRYFLEMEKLTYDYEDYLNNANVIEDARLP